jgi:hypothetical protein
MGDWKGVRVGVKRNPRAPLELYNLRDDVAESRNVAADRPEVVSKIERVMREGRTESPIWPLVSR